MKQTNTELALELGITNISNESDDALDELSGSLSDPEQHLLLEQCMSKIALDLEAIKSQLEFALKRGVIADHSRLIVWQAKENIENMLDRLNAMGE
jgi:hypothetical protein